MKKVTALLLAVLMVFTLAACQKNSAAGTYILTSAEINGEIISAEGILNASITLEKDGTMIVSDDSSSEMGTWTQKGNVITQVSETGTTRDMVLEGDKLIVDVDGDKLIFERSK